MNRHLIVKSSVLPGVIASVVFLVFILTLGFAFYNPKPHMIPVALVAPPPIATEIKQTLELKVPGVFSIRTLPDVQTAQQAIRQQKINGAAVLSAHGMQLLTASSAGSADQELFTKVFGSAAQAMHLPFQTHELTPRTAAPQTSLLTVFLLLITTISTVIVAILMRIQNPKQDPRLMLVGSLIAALLVGATAGVCLALLKQFPGHYLAISEVIGWYAFCMILLVSGAYRLLRKAGLAIVILLLIPLGMATAGVLFSAHFLPLAYQVIAPYMPSAALVSAIHQVADFQHAALMRPLIVLGTWGVLGVILYSLGVVMHRKTAISPTSTTHK